MIAFTEHADHVGEAPGFDVVGFRVARRRREIAMVRGDARGSTSGGSGRLSGGAIASLVGIGVLAIFMVQNIEDVTLTILFWSFTWPLWLFTLVTVRAGALVWFGLGIVRRHRRRKARRG